MLEVQKHFGLPSPALVEKDWYVVRALAALSAANTVPFRLVFGGGTAWRAAGRPLSWAVEALLRGCREGCSHRIRPASEPRGAGAPSPPGVQAKQRKGANSSEEACITAMARHYILDPMAYTERAGAELLQAALIG